MNIFRYFLFVLFCGTATAITFSQDAAPSRPEKPFTVKKAADIKAAAKKLKDGDGNLTEDIVNPSGGQARIAVFYDEKRVDDNFEVHDRSDDMIYVLDGEGHLMLGGELTDLKQISPGEWRARSATGTTRVDLKKGDVIFVPRGTVHQRTVNGKGLMLLFVKVYRDKQP